MAPEVVNWTLTFAILLVAVWVGFLILAVQWVLNNAAVLLGFVAAVALLAFAVHEVRH